MTSSFNQPQPNDAVLGSQVTAALGSVVLGGLEGIQQRLASNFVEQRIAALREIQQSGQALDSLIDALKDPSLQVQKVAYLLLQTRPETAARQALQRYSPYSLFECRCTLTGHATGITAIATYTQQFRYRPDQDIIISASRDGVIKVWDLEAREELFSVNARSFVYTLAIDAEAEVFVAKCKNQIVKAWSLKTEQKVMPPQKRPKSIASVTVSHNRHLISSSQDAIKVWDLQLGREVCLLRGHTSLVSAVAVNDRGNTASNPHQSVIISGSEDCTLKVWGIS